MTPFLVARRAGAALLAGCADHPPPATVPLGLAYSCAGDPVTVVYDGQGYLPGSTVPASGEQARPAWRARASLQWRGQSYDMFADDALEDLRYVENRSADEADRRLVWVARAEAAELREIDQDGNETAVAACTRTRSPSGDTPEAAPNHPRGPEAPHRR